MENLTLFQTVAQTLSEQCKNVENLNVEKYGKKFAIDQITNGQVLKKIKIFFKLSLNF